MINQRQILQSIICLTETEGKNLSEKMNKLFEEGGELARASLIFSKAPGTKYRNVENPEEEVLEELADVQIVLLSILYDNGFKFSYDSLLEKVAEKLKKWEAVQKVERNTHEQVWN